MVFLVISRGDKSSEFTSTRASLALQGLRQGDDFVPPSVSTKTGPDTRSFNIPATLEQTSSSSSSSAFPQSTPMSAPFPSLPGSTDMSTQWLEKVDNEGNLAHVKLTAIPQPESPSLRGERPCKTSENLKIASGESRPLSTQNSTASQQHGFLDAVPAIPYDPFSIKGQKLSPEKASSSSGPKHRPPPIAVLSESETPTNGRNSRPFSFIGPLPSPAWSCDGSCSPTTSTSTPPVKMRQDADSKSSQDRFANAFPSHLVTAISPVKEEQEEDQERGAIFVAEGKPGGIPPISELGVSIPCKEDEQRPTLSVSCLGREELPFVNSGAERPTLTIPGSGRGPKYGSDSVEPPLRTVSTLWQETDVGTLEGSISSGQTHTRTASSHTFRQPVPRLRPALPPQTRSQTMYVTHHSSPPAPRPVPGCSLPHPHQMSPSISPHPFPAQDGIPDPFSLPIHSHQCTPVHHFPPSRFRDHEPTPARMGSPMGPPRKHLAPYEWPTRDTWNPQFDVQYSERQVYPDIFLPSTQARQVYGSCDSALSSRFTWVDGSNALTLDSRPPDRLSYYPPETHFPRARSTTLSSAPNPHYIYFQPPPSDVPFSREFSQRFQSSPDLSIPPYTSKTPAMPELLHPGPSPRTPFLSTAPPRVTSQYLNFDSEAVPRAVSGAAGGHSGEKDKGRIRSLSVGFFKSLRKRKATKE